ncbi:MAG: ABC transporter substrate-binding protein [Ardenticatenaceae bacterium]|nr:ABC transporter substrate-binding protein [Ardenticatenaceae bacterium]
MKKRTRLPLLILLLGAVISLLIACQPQVVEVEVTREVVETQEVVVTEEVEVVVTEEVQVEVVVEATEVPPPQGGNVVESSFADLNTLNPVLGNDNASSTVYTRMFASLARLDPVSGAIIPYLADSWDVSEDGLTYTFTIREDAVWSDDTPITAQDIAFTFDAINTDEVASPRRSNFTEVDSWAVIDDKTFELTLKSVDCTVLANLGPQGIIPAHAYDGDPLNIPDSEENTAPSIVSGPFQFVDWIPDDRATLAANPNYFLGQPNVDTWTFRVYADQSAEIAGLLANEHTYTDPIGPQFVSVIEGEVAGGRDMGVQKYFSNGYTFVGYNLANPENPQNGWDDLDGDGVWTDGEPPLEQDPHPVLGQLEVRQAIANSIDYTGIINKVIFGQGGPTVANVWPSITWAYNNDLTPYEQDLELAAQILADAGWTPGSETNDAGVPILEKDGQQLRLRLMTNAGNETRENIGIIMKDVLDQLGFSIELDYKEFGTVVQDLLGQTYDMVIIGFGGGPPEPDDSSQFSYKNDEVGAGFNFVSYYNEDFEANLDAGKAVPGCSEDERASFYVENQELMYNDLPYSFFYIPLNSGVAWNQLSEITPNTWDTYYNMEQWFFTQ